MRKLAHPVHKKLIDGFVLGALLSLTIATQAEPTNRVDRDLGTQYCQVVVQQPDPAHPMGDTTDSRIFI